MQGIRVTFDLAIGPAQRHHSNLRGSSGNAKRSVEQSHATRPNLNQDLDAAP